MDEPSATDTTGSEPSLATIRVLVVDDHDLFRTGLSSLIGAEPGIEVVGQASNGATGVRLASELRPDVVLMDLRMPALSGVEATRQIVAQRPLTRVLALTIASEAADIASALAAGACGFLAKDTPVDGLLAAIRAAATGAAWLSPRAAEIVLGQVRAQPPEDDRQDPGVAPLSPRELEVLRLIAAGKDNAQIAHTLSISPRTAKNHVSSVLAKLGVTSRVQAAVYAVRRGID